MAQATDGLVVQDLNHGTTAQSMAQSLIGGGVTISNVVYTGANNAAGTFTDTGPGSVVGFNAGIVMGSGSVQTTAASTADSKGVEGPNQSDGNTTINNTPGDADLNTLSGKTTYDAAVLEFDFVPQFSTVQFTYVFTSDEYNEYANTAFNDTFGFLINGQNCALVPGTSTPVGVNTINGGNPFGTNAQHPELFRNNDLDDGGGSINTEMDGLTVVLTCNANVNAGVTNHMKLAIADASDQVLDSNVFIQAGSLVSGHTLTVTKAGTGSGTVTSSPAGIDCGATCSAEFTEGTMVTLTATPAAGSTFTGWSGACSGTGTCTVTMDQDRAVTATFALAPTSVGALSAGYWKTHQAQTTALLPITLGNYTVSTFAQATAVFKNMNCGTSSQNGAAGCLAGQLLAAKLNVKNGAGTCIAPTIADADAFLVSINYVGPSGTYSLSAAQRALAIQLKDALDRYNNGLGC